MAQMCGDRLKYIKNCLDYVRNGLMNWRKGLNMWEMAKICGKWLKYLRKG